MIQAPVRVRVEQFSGDVLGIGTPTPRLSWEYNSPVPENAKAEIRVERRKPRHGANESTISVDSSQNILLPWQFEPLDSRELVNVFVRVKTDKETSEWSRPLFFDVGLLMPHQRVADFVGPSWPEAGTDHRPQPLVRTEFTIREKPVLARLYLTALGLVSARINGHRVGVDQLNPGWTSYDNRLECWTYDVLDLIHEGANALGLLLADGWYRGRVGFDGGEANVWGDKIGAFAQLEVTYANGERQSLYSNSSDERWKTTLGPIVRSNIYEGETYDARKEMPGWDRPGFDDSSWQPVAEIPFDEHKIEFPVMRSIQPDKIQEDRTIHVTAGVEPGTWLIDTGQNASQRLKLHMHGLKAGQEISVQHAEVLDKEGNLVTTILKRGHQLDTYISNGKDGWWEPEFDMHGFRYALVKGWEGTLTHEDIKCTVYHTAMERIGWFDTSNEMVNKLSENTVWALRSNFMSIPTDCPQRDERVGWTADIAVFSPTALYLYNAAGFLRNWLRDLAFEQKKNGTVPFYIPYVPMGIWSDPQAIAIWGDAAVLVPWALYMATADKDALQEQYPAAVTWVNEVHGYLSPDGVWDRRPEYALGQLGDWLDPTAPPESPDQAMTAKELVATAFYIHSCDLLAQMAVVLGNDDDRKRFSHFAEVSRAGYGKRFVAANGRMTSDTQCAYTLSIMFDLVPDKTLMEGFGNRLAELVRSSDWKIGTGFAGTAYILPALAKSGHLDEAYGLFLSTKCPSWLYQVSMGATTTWERWDSMEPDGSLNPGGMTSFNHYALGSVNNWAYSTIAGISPMSPGWKTIKVAPRPGGGITHASAKHLTPYGLISIAWNIDSDSHCMHLSLHVPYGATACLDLPGTRQEWLKGGDYQRQYSL